MFYRYPINDVHIHLFDPKDIDECIAMVDECGYTNWTFLACTVIDSPFALAQNLLCALMKLRERGRTQDMALEDWERLAAENPMVTVEDRQVLDAALTALADDERQIVLLHAVTGWKHREIAGLLELPLSTVLSKYRRALLKLKTKLEGGDAL